MNPNNVLIFGAHPDDEAVGTGGVVIQYARAGFDVYFVCMTGGGSLPQVSALSREKIIEVRREMQDKCKEVLGLKEIIRLGLPDLGVRAHLKDRQLTGVITGILKRLSPQKIFVHWAFDSHPDHQATNAIVRQAISEWGGSCLLLEYSTVYYEHITEKFGFLLKFLPRLKKHLSIPPRYDNDPHKDPKDFDPDLYVDISREFACKEKAMRVCGGKILVDYTKLLRGYRSLARSHAAEGRELLYGSGRFDVAELPPNRLPRLLFVEAFIRHVISKGREVDAGFKPLVYPNITMGLKKGGKGIFFTERAPV